MPFGRLFRPKQREAAAEAGLGHSDGRRGRGPVTAEEVAHRAYAIWVRRGRPEGTAVEDWLEAERQLREESRGGSADPMKSR